MTLNGALIFTKCLLAKALMVSVGKQYFPTHKAIYFLLGKWNKSLLSYWKSVIIIENSCVHESHPFSFILNPMLSSWKFNYGICCCLISGSTSSCCFFLTFYRSNCFDSLISIKYWVMILLWAITSLINSMGL